MSWRFPKGESRSLDQMRELGLGNVRTVTTGNFAGNVTGNLPVVPNGRRWIVISSVMTYVNSNAAAKYPYCVANETFSTGTAQTCAGWLPLVSVPATAGTYYLMIVFPETVIYEKTTVTAGAISGLAGDTLTFTMVVLELPI